MTASDQEPIEYRIAETREELEGAARLVYCNYLQKGYCAFNAHQMYFHQFDPLAGTRTIVAVQKGRVIATLTLVFDSDRGLPSDTLYRDELALLRGSGHRLAEITKLSIDRAVRTKQVGILHQLSRLAYLVAARARGITAFCILVEPHHERFYRKICLFERMGEMKEDPSANNAPTILLRLNLEEAPSKAREAFGDNADASNLYWFYCVDPQAKKLEAAARAADRRLHEAVTAQNAEALSAEQRRYLQFREFAHGIAAQYGKNGNRQRAASRDLARVS
jgi:hypothetical protein